MILLVAIEKNYTKRECSKKQERTGGWCATYVEYLKYREIMCYILVKIAQQCR